MLSYPFIIMGRLHKVIYLFFLELLALRLSRQQSWAKLILYAFEHYNIKLES
jgi:hypothetical protein